MELRMFLGTQLVDSMPLKLSTIVLPGYLGHLKRKLDKKHNKLIASSGIEPEYFVYQNVIASTQLSTSSIIVTQENI